jgi:hypothetical protein
MAEYVPKEPIKFPDGKTDADALTATDSAVPPGTAVRKQTADGTFTEWVWSAPADPPGDGTPPTPPPASTGDYNVSDVTETITTKRNADKIFSVEKTGSKEQYLVFKKNDKDDISNPFDMIGGQKKSKSQKRGGKKQRQTKRKMGGRRRSNRRR